MAKNKKIELLPSRRVGKTRELEEPCYLCDTPGCIECIPCEDCVYDGDGYFKELCERCDKEENGGE